MRTRTLVLISCAGLFWFWQAGGHRFDSEVARIINTPQTYDGELQDNLVALGPDAAPALGRKLSGDYGFPLELVMALGTIGDPRGTAPLLEFLQSFAPYDDSEVEVLPIAAIEALKDIGNPLVCDTLAAIFPDDKVLARARLAAAGAVARICTGPQQAGARAWVMARYAEMKADPWALMGWSDLVYKALIDVNSDEVIDGLMAIVASPESRYEMHYRIAAADALLDLGEYDNPELEVRIRALLDDAIQNRRPEPFIADARSLVNKLDSR